MVNTQRDESEEELVERMEAEEELKAKLADEAPRKVCVCMQCHSRGAAWEQQRSSSEAHLCEQRGTSV